MEKGRTGYFYSPFVKNFRESLVSRQISERTGAEREDATCVLICKKSMRRKRETRKGNKLCGEAKGGIDWSPKGTQDPREIDVGGVARKKTNRASNNETGKTRGEKREKVGSRLRGHKVSIRRKTDDLNTGVPN